MIIDLKQMLMRAYLMGFKKSCDGYNGERDYLQGDDYMKQKLIENGAWDEVDTILEYPNVCEDD